MLELAVDWEVPEVLKAVMAVALSEDMVVALLEDMVEVMVVLEDTVVLEDMKVLEDMVVATATALPVSEATLKADFQAMAQSVSLGERNTITDTEHDSRCEPTL